MSKLTPSPEQQRIIESKARFIAIDGNAGAGKTITLAQKVVRSLRGGMPSSKILVLTYTREAVLAFQQRLRWLGLTKEQVAKLRIQSFDDFCHELLFRQQGECVLLEKPNRVVQEKVVLAIERARDWALKRGFDDSFDIVGDGSLAIAYLLQSFRLLKGTLALHSMGPEFRLTPTSALDAGLDFTQVAALQAYERLRLEGDDLDEIEGQVAPRFRLPGDPVYDMVRLVEAEEPAYRGLHPLAGLLQLVVVDEGHDINASIFSVMQHLVQQNPSSQLLIVGDPDQVVHSEGGADAAYMREEFERGIGPLTRLPLTRSFRCAEQVSDALGRHARKAFGFQTGRQDEVHVSHVNNVRSLAALIQGELQVGKDEGGLAVLMRHPGDAVGLEIELAQRGLLVETRGFQRLFDRPEILLVRTLLAWVADSLSTLAQVRIQSIVSALDEFTGCLSHEVTRDVRIRDVSHLSAVVLSEPDSVKEWAARDSRRVASVGRPLVCFSDPESLQCIVRLIQVFESGVQPGNLASRVREANLAPLLKRGLVAEQDVEDALVAIGSFAESAAGYESLQAWLEQMATLEFEGSASRKSRSNETAVVRLYSIPAAKGLEFSSVIIPNVDAQWFDGRRQEDRNLFYVAASRARDRLTMTYRSTPSTYLDSFTSALRYDLST